MPCSGWFETTKWKSVMDDVARRSPGDRRDLFTEAAAERGNISAAVIEKDFWVCWTLKQLFGLDTAPARLIFKGGTSLSKVYGVIERFSEDIDLSLNREDLGFVGEHDPYAANSGKKAKALVEEIVALCRTKVVRVLGPQLEERIESVLGPPDVVEGWSLEGDAGDPQTIYFKYPAGIGSGGQGGPGSYIPRVVRLEFGARSDHWPAEEHEIRPYAADAMPEQFKSPACRVNALSAERTFWEKATLLHALAHKPLQKSLGERMSRHYYDVARLYQSGFGPKALKDSKLLDSVVAHKRLFFASGWANYSLAKPGTFRLIPPRDGFTSLAADYRAMQENMIFGESYVFDDLMAVLAEVEAKINGMLRAEKS
jgi:Nucleotidyl transferase AbiEii toxin, Type IV TA system